MLLNTELIIFMKGLDAPTIIAIVIAIVVAAALLYFFWTRGANPLSSGVSESECITKFLRACNSDPEWENLVGSPTASICKSVLERKVNLHGCEITQSGVQRSSSECISFCNELEGVTQ
jgi:hypothetical protein